MTFFTLAMRFLFREKKLQVFQERFLVKWKALDGVGSASKFLNRKITTVKEGLMVVPRTQVMKLVEKIENHFGQSARAADSM